MISAKVIQDSISPQGKRITTYELNHVRFVHAEFLTHRVFSRNSASSRAIPIEKMIETIEKNPAMPIHWGKNQSGMQAKEQLEGHKLWQAQQIWLSACSNAIQHSRNMANLGVHKQIANRITEPYQWMKVIMTTTEDVNWYWLRDHPDAQPEIRELAICMQSAKDNSVPMLIYPGEWHVPYVTRERVVDGINYFTVSNINEDGISFTVAKLTVDEAKMISARCWAQVSYSKNDDSLEKAEVVFGRLIDSEPVHASPVEHQATPMDEEKNDHNRAFSWEEGVTHFDRYGRFWSNNFQGWIQYRALIPNNVKQ